MKTFSYEKMPGIAELWDDCIYSLVYDTKKYVLEIEELFKKIGITKNSKILDSSAGSGFPAFELSKDGYQMSCMDFSDNEIEVFNKKAKLFNSNLICTKLSWLDIPKKYPKESFDFLFNRGNSFIYASGGWEEKSGKLNKEIALSNYKKVLQVFYNSLKKGGYIYIDKFKDNEITSNEQVGKVVVAGREYDWFFSRRPDRKNKVRYAKMIFVDSGKKETEVVSFTTYLLSFKELIRLMKEVGFKKIKKIKIPAEIDFDIVIAQK
jgi:ubiquinone/menaquinone biosynthesis C-methylase UbiE